MNREEKAAVIDQIADGLVAPSDLRVLDSESSRLLRWLIARELRSTDTKLRVTNRCPARRPGRRAGLSSMLFGPTALALVKGDTAAATEVLTTRHAPCAGLCEFKGGIHQRLGPERGRHRGHRQAAHATCSMLVGSIAAPLSGFTRTLDTLIAGVAVQLGQIRDPGLVSRAEKRRRRRAARPTRLTTLRATRTLTRQPPLQRATARG